VTDAQLGLGLQLTGDIEGVLAGEDSDEAPKLAERVKESGTLPLAPGVWDAVTMAVAETVTFDVVDESGTRDPDAKAKVDDVELK